MIDILLATVPPETLNPLTLLESAGDIMPGGEGPAGSSGVGGSLELIVLFSVLSIAPAILMLCTCFTRVVIVLGVLRQALGTQSMPPNQVIIGLSVFLSLVVMGPTLERMYDEGIQPFSAGELTSDEAWTRTRQPLRDFMFAQLDATGNWSGIHMILEYRGVDTSEEIPRADIDMLTLVPAFILSELKVAFLMGFRIYLPFLVIDLIIASMLVSTGMLMVPPVLVSLPFKLLLFVLVDGWQLVAGSLLASVAQPDIVALLAMPYLC